MSKRTWLPSLAVGLAALIGAQAARAQTASLELKVLPDGERGFFGSEDDLVPPEAQFGMVRPQGFGMQIGGEDAFPADDGGFSELVREEPGSYVSEHPFRGVAELGDHRYAFVLDSSVPGRGYDRLILDENRNGDLLDDPVRESGESPEFFGDQNYTWCTFPRLELEIEVGGKAMELALVFSAHTFEIEEGTTHVSVSLETASYREGEIEVDGVRRRIVLVDFDCNGRYDDRVRIEDDIEFSGGIYPSPGDILFIDPKALPIDEAFGDALGLGDGRQLLSRLARIDGRLYEIEVTPCGDEVSFTPSELAMGEVENPNRPWRAMVYGEQGFLAIQATDGGRAALPAGEWKLLSYTIDLTEEEPEEEPAGEEKKPSLFELIGSSLAGSEPGPRTTLVSARATAGYAPVQVRAGLVAELPFGPPYRPLVEGARLPGERKAILSLSLVGSQGEVCSDLRVNGFSPPEPSFLITAPDGEVVKRGKFEYG